MIMPYGIKATNLDVGKGPATINFDALWNKVYRPLLEDDLKYEAVRGDEEISPLILHAMVESLALSDLVVADISIPNANVYWEVGLRYGASERGCVLTSAEWAMPAFDLGQVRHVRFPLSDGSIPDEQVAPMREALRAGIEHQREQRSVLHEILPGWPNISDQATRTERFRRRVDQLRGVASRIDAIRAAGRGEQKGLAVKAAEAYAVVAASSLPIALEIIALLRDLEAWQETAGFIDGLPQAMQDAGVVREQRNLATSKLGDHLTAITALRELIRTRGDTSERRGLLGGRFKKLWVQASDPVDRDKNLTEAITEYSKAMLLDLNNYYPSSNLPRLLRSRKAPGDEALAREAVAATHMACRRAQALDPDDAWLLPTRLGAAFDAGDVGEAEQLAWAMRHAGLPRFNLATTLADLELSIANHPDAAVRAPLAEIAGQLRALLPAPSSGGAPAG